MMQYSAPSSAPLLLYVILFLSLHFLIPVTSTSTVFRNASSSLRQRSGPIIPIPTPIPDMSCTWAMKDRRVRKEIRDLNPFELSRYHRAMKNLLNARKPGSPRFPPPSFWDKLVLMHIFLQDQAHDGSYFLLWHRLYLLALENYIRENWFPNFALPYWDWSAPADWRDPAMSEIWKEMFIGGSVTNQSIPNGPFKGATALYIFDHNVSRGFRSGQSGSMNPFTNASTLNNLMRASIPFEDFSDAIEAAHDVVHVEIGGDMLSLLTAPNDPVFYLHHAFVDWMWHVRQSTRGKFDFGGTHQRLGPGGNRTQVKVERNFLFRYLNVTAQSAFDQPCVEYQYNTGAPRYSKDNAKGQGGTTGNGNYMTKENIKEICLASTTMSFKRCENGYTILTRYTI